MEITVDTKNDKRIDSYLSNKLDYSRSKIEKMIENNLIFVNNKKIKRSYIPKEGDLISIEEMEEIKMDVEAEDIPIDIVYEDDDVIVVNKANGMVVHPAVGNNSGTLVNALLFHSKSLSSINGEFRPGIVHRIDAYTTGLLMVAKNDKSHEILAQELSRSKTKRKYIALVWGVINEDTATIDAPIGRDFNDRKKMAITSEGKMAITHLRVLERYSDATLVELTLETGRTHQIRVHMNYINHPIVNDYVYGYKKVENKEFGQMLHAKTIGFNHPKTNEYLEFSIDAPKEFYDILNIYEKEV